jgi:hypothetical protein
VIQGSKGSVNSPNEFIGREDYVNIRHPATFTYTEQRNNVYDLFLKYKQWKGRWQQHDIADR